MTPALVIEKIREALVRGDDFVETMREDPYLSDRAAGVQLAFDAVRTGLETMGDNPSIDDLANLIKNLSYAQGVLLGIGGKVSIH